MSYCCHYLGITKLGANIGEGRMIDEKEERAGKLPEFLFRVEFGDYLFIFFLWCCIPCIMWELEFFFLMAG